MESIPTNETVGVMPDPNGPAISFDTVSAPNGDVDGLSFGAGPFTVDAETFDRIVWPLMSDLARSNYTNTGACAIYR